MNAITDCFGSMVFNDSAMRQRLPENVFRQLRHSMQEGERLDGAAAEIIADAMKNWAIEKGATHFCHWFQPMTGITAEKHDSFIAPAENGKVIMEFSGKELIKGEPDASSLPSGGLRATFEARGYTAWDPSSYAFIKDGVLCIPTAFCSYGGEALDKKTPLLRSMEAINKQTMRVLRLFGNEAVSSVKTTVGPEQEYFLIDREYFQRRKDLIFTGRTLFGSRPPKGQELGDHYFGAIQPKVAAFMKELDAELWKLGIMAKTEHNETAPCQHELAPVFTTANIAADHNQLTMEIMQNVAKKNGMVCLLHEKPFAGINGSGKHNNWSMVTNTGVNLLEPGETPWENAQFLLFLCAVIQAVDDYQDMFRLSVTSPANDQRLGGDEAPPAIMSVYLGSEIEAILDAIENDEAYGSHARELIKVGVHVLPRIPKDNSDRNRTSPFAFTGNKFEFRMLGSSASISGANVVTNTAVAESLRQYADILENAQDFEAQLHQLIKSVIKKHRRIIFNGNGYGEEWIKEAKSRGLLNLPSTPDCVPCYLAEKNVQLFTAHKVYSPVELHARYEMKLENYSKVLNIEALTMMNMVWKDILPAVSSYSGALAASANAKRSLCPDADLGFERELVDRLCQLTAETVRRSRTLQAALDGASDIHNSLDRARYYHDSVLSSMDSLRDTVDELEKCTEKSRWPFPSYGDILFKS